MFNAFMDDKSGFKNIVILVLLLSFVVLGGTFMLLGRYNASVAKNSKDIANFEAQSVWLRKYDADTVNKIEKMMLYPCKENEVEKVQKEQLQMLAEKGVKVTGVRKATMASNKNAKNALKGIKTSITFDGEWNNIVAALNAFEKRHLVVITDLILNSKDGISGRMEYVIYYR